LRRACWYVNYQDVVAIGDLFLTGRLRVDRVVALGGPAARDPRLLRTRLGASLAELTSGECSADVGRVRVISGSVLAGRRCEPMREHLGRYHGQVVLMPEGGKREFLGWIAPGRNKFSLKPVFLSALSRPARAGGFPMTTSTNGSLRAIVPIGAYEQVMPLDILATPLLRALVTEDTAYAQALGCMELDEEDLALCSYVCPSKIEYGQFLRRVLTLVEKEG
jgi:Na+-transporting NADH:ubiquinone oxidoreductase subunit A